MSLEGFVSIDANTSRGLQLLTSNDSKSKKLSLFNILNYCQTPMGGKNFTNNVDLLLKIRKNASLKLIAASEQY